MKPTKTALLPAVHVEPQLLIEVGDVLREGESLSEFVEESVRRAVERRLVQRDFHARGEASWLHYQQTGESYPVEAVLAELRALTEARRKQFRR